MAMLIGPNAPLVMERGTRLRTKFFEFRSYYLIRLKNMFTQFIFTDLNPESPSIACRTGVIFFAHFRRTEAKARRTRNASRAPRENAKIIFFAPASLSPLFAKDTPNNYASSAGYHSGFNNKQS